MTPKPPKTPRPKTPAAVNVGELYKPLLLALIGQFLKDADQNPNDLAIALAARASEYAAKPDADGAVLNALNNQASNLPRSLSHGQPQTMRSLMIILEALGWTDVSFIIQARKPNGQVITSGVDLNFAEAQVGMLSVDVTGTSSAKPKAPTTPLRTKPAGPPEVHGHDNLIARLRRAQALSADQLPIVLMEEPDEPTT